jgi:[ribosomal protein S5]-alanine N-acetyltransferase
VAERIWIRLVRVDDAEALSEAYRVNRRFLAPWEPTRDDSFFTTEGQRVHLAKVVRDMDSGAAYRCVIEDDETRRGGTWDDIPPSLLDGRSS